MARSAVEAEWGGRRVGAAGAPPSQGRNPGAKRPRPPSCTGHAHAITTCASPSDHACSRA